MCASEKLALAPFGASRNGQMKVEGDARNPERGRYGDRQQSRAAG
jgi:hypothetical protein